MAVIYMRKLEEEPRTYDTKFTTLTKGVNLRAQEWILDQIQSSSSILEIGCGPGILAKKMALKGNEVLAIDKNFQMINHAMQNYPTEENVNLIYQIGDFKSFKLDKGSKDIIVSTFALSELRPFEQQIFLRFAWKKLKQNGRLLIADEFIPSGFWKLQFSLKRWYYKKKMRITKIKNSNALRWFLNYVEAIGFKINVKKTWKHGTILAMELKKIKDI
jgi:2-polyprenyl-3-methyl-5-hydroxy-6-metoxy-1,4-benzoquinol methylase